MTPSGRRALWIGAVLLLLFSEGGGENVERSFTPTDDDASLELRIGLNGAGIAELESLPGIGPALAARIEGHRLRNGPFQRVEGLAAVSGIGASRIRILTPFLTVGEEGALSATGE